MKTIEIIWTCADGEEAAVTKLAHALQNYKTEDTTISIEGGKITILEKTGLTKVINIVTKGVIDKLK